MKSDEPAIEQTIDIRRQKKSICPIKPLRWTTIPPRFYVASDQQLLVINTRHTAKRLASTNILPKLTLTSPGLYNGFLLRLWKVGILKYSADHFVVDRFRSWRREIQTQRINLPRARQAAQNLEKFTRYFCKKDILIAVSGRLDRRIFLGEQSPNYAYVISRKNGTFNTEPRNW